MPAESAIYAEINRISAGKGLSAVAPTIIRIDDKAMPYLAWMAASLPRMFNRALKSIGWWMRGQIRKGMATENPGGIMKWPALSRVTQTRVLDAYRGLRKKKRGRGYIRPRRFKFSKLKAGGKLYQAVVYRAANMQVQIGWMTPSAAKAGQLFQTSFERPVTPKMRRFFNVAGLKLGAGPIKHPARELIKPVYDASQTEILRRITLNIERQMLMAGSDAQDMFQVFRSVNPGVRAA